MTFGDVKIGSSFIGDDDFEYVKLGPTWAIRFDSWHTFNFSAHELITPLALIVTEVKDDQ